MSDYVAMVGAALLIFALLFTLAYVGTFCYLWRKCNRLERRLQQLKAQSAAVGQK